MTVCVRVCLCVFESVTSDPSYYAGCVWDYTLDEERGQSRGGAGLRTGLPAGTVHLFGLQCLPILVHATCAVC